MKQTKLAIICGRGLETFIEPITVELEKDDAYQVHRYYCNTQQEIIAAVKWADIVWLEWANETTVTATQIYDIKKKGVICRLHSYEALGNFPSQIDWSMVDYLVFVAPHIKDIVKRQIADIDDRVCCKVIYNGLDIDNIPENKRRDDYNIAYVAHINYKKAPELVLQIMSKLVYGDADGKNFRLHVAGAWQDERYKIYLKYLAKEMGIADNIIYYGFIQDMSQFWEGKGVILSTSIHEGHPYNIMEGMAHGLKPVVHNFMGAKNLYKSEWLYNMIDEAVEKIYRQSCFDYRQYVIDMGWTLDNQMKQVKELIGNLRGE